jgi:hypothetical protein
MHQEFNIKTEYPSEARKGISLAFLLIHKGGSCANPNDESG